MTQKNRTLKILVIGDLHGAMPKIHFKKFDAIIAPGDFCLDKDIRKYIMKAYGEFLKNPNSHRDWYDICGKKNAKRYIQKSLKYGRRILERLNSYDVPVYIIPGNWDMFEKDKDLGILNRNNYKENLIKRLRNVHDCHEKILKVGEYKIIGYGLVNGPELLKYRGYKNITRKSYVKNEKRYKELVRKYNIKFKGKKNIIFLSHNVPFNTTLDKIKNKGNPMDGKHYGSNLARDMIEKHKPLICIAGHMHEHYGTCRIGKTTVLNAGFGGEKNTLLELEDGKIKNIRFYGKKK